MFFLAFALLAFIALPALGDEAAAEATSSDNEKNIITFFGRMHVLILHLPIGMLLGAFIVEVLGFFKRSKGYDIAAAWLFVLGAGAAAVAVTTGLMLENAEGTGSLTEQWHKWLGISVGVIALAGAICKIMAVRKQWGGEQRASGGGILLIARISLILLAMLLLPVTGHLGGNMTHGNTFLTEHSPVAIPEKLVYFPEETPAVVEAAEGSLEARWVAEVQPILNEYCISCHGTSKQSADIRLDSLEMALAGGDGGETVLLVPGSAFDSLIYRVSALPSHDDARMPPGPEREGLVSEDLEALGNWLVDAANLGNETPGGGSTDASGDPANDEPTFDQAAADVINAAGGRASAISINSTKMEVSFANVRPLPNDALASLATGADNIEKLYLQMSGVTDAGLASLPDMRLLDRLDLKDTAITDSGLANLPKMDSIRWINLFGTAITDAGLEHLVRYEFTLEEVFLTGTDVTAEGVEALRESLPDTTIYSDFDDNLSLAIPGDSPDDTTPVNTTCPVTDQPVDPAHTIVHDGRVIGFCCPNCPAAFTANPAQFADKLPAP